MNSKSAERTTAGSSSAFRAADSLTLAATPVFACMALLTLRYEDTRGLLCGAANGAPWNGMVAMYLLMCVAHMPPWLKLLARRRIGIARTGPQSKASL
jgi:hypothetical protein